MGKVSAAPTWKYYGQLIVMANETRKPEGGSTMLFFFDMFPAASMIDIFEVCNGNIINKDRL